MNQTNHGIAGLHIVRYGTAADQKYLAEDFLDTYDQLVINANMVAHTPAALATFVTQRTKSKPYFIDPQTHAFQHDISHLESTSKKNKSEATIKRSIRKLLDAYGDPARKNILSKKNPRPIQPKDFDSKRKIEEFCRRVLEFQFSAISKEIEKSDAAKYYKFLKKKNKGVYNSFSPSIVVAPYFYLSFSSYAKWLRINLDCAVASQEIARSLGAPLAVQVVLSKEILQERGSIDKIADYYALGVRPDAFLLWVDSFVESQATHSELIAFVQLLKKLSKHAQVVNLYGGFFSVALARGVLKGQIGGVTHGIEYGEDRGVAPVGGGLPIAKYYMPPLRVRLSSRNALRPIRALDGFRDVASFHRVICSCKQCIDTIAENPEEDFDKYGRSRPVSFIRQNHPIVIEYPLPETKDRCVRHYMWSKAKEYDVREPIKASINQLRRTGAIMRKTQGESSFTHCERWVKVLTSA